ncbi:hypothetical protein ACJJTC_001416 [Scirpophaga incertulas]
MELAGQWRREWAGTAEYGKVTEGGVTRRVARAMEVLHASGPNAKVRVMRAAYHSTSGPGLPASSYMLHSSRRVISSGFNLLDSPTYPSKPLEISSTPLETSPDYTEAENYKVTEPDDIEISEPSKWRGTSNGNDIRMPSEESSSTDNASIIDLSQNGSSRKYSYDSENSDSHFIKGGNVRASPILDAPATLSTLKYKSLLNGSNSTSDWNIRRKSYSFENTSPLNETIVQSNETLAMESSTDSGICKSSEVVNEYPEESESRRHDNSFEEWLKNNRLNIIQKDHKVNDFKDCNINMENTSDEHKSFIKRSKFRPCNGSDGLNDQNQNNITLQSSGKVCITVPITLEYDENSEPVDEIERKIKKVGFCKTELHFAAESGRVNIISTDEKPPPTNDFRKRRSAFVPINAKYERSITLFGEKNDYSELNTIKDQPNFSQLIENDENTAATKSILKNKIPKPKPYLLGENMAFGDFQTMNSLDETSTPIGVSITNKQLQSKSTNNESSNNHTNNKCFMNSLRTRNNSPSKEHSSGYDDLLKMSPVNIPKSRQLRENELIYFGIENHNHKKNIVNINIQPREKQKLGESIDAFESVRLVKQASNSAQNSEAESDDAPEYQNLPIKSNFAPTPTPRSRVRYKKPNESVVILKPIIEQQNDAISHEWRRSRSRKQDVDNLPSCRSLSEPAKQRSDSGMSRQDEIRSSITKDTRRRYKENNNEPDISRKSEIRNERCAYLKTEKSPHEMYENIKNRQYKQDLHFNNNTQYKFNYCDKQKSSIEANNKKYIKSNINEKKEKYLEKLPKIQRTEKLSTPENIYRKNHNAKQESTNESIKNSTIESHDTKQTRIKTNNRLVELKITEGKEDATSSQDSSSRKQQVTNKKTKIDKSTDISKNTNNTNQTSPICLEKQENTEGKKHTSQLTVKTEDSCYPSNINETKRNGSNKKGIHKSIKSGSLESNISKQKVRSDQDSSTSGRKSSRKSEYIIKYDDKNGTVSSVCKVRGRHDNSKNKFVSKDRNRDHSKDSKDKLKEKSGLRK